MNKLDDILQRRFGNRMGQIEWEYWCEVAKEFLERYEIELGMAGAYNGHLAILLREVYVKGQEDSQEQPTKVSDMQVDSPDMKSGVNSKAAKSPTSEERG